MKPITLNLCGASYTGVIRSVPYISGGAPALLFESKSGRRIATLSVNMVGEPLMPNHTFIKDHSENEGVLGQLVNLGVVRDTGTRKPTGFVTVPLVEIIEPSLRQ